jgi:ribosomal protein L17
MTAAELIRHTFPTCTMSQARQYRARIDGKMVTFYAEDSVDAVREAQRRGNLEALVEDR